MKWEKILIALVSAGFAVILYILLPIESEKYRLTFVKQEPFPYLEDLQYADLDGDQESELIRWKKEKPVPAIVVQRANNQIVDQWNLNGEWIDRAESTFSDFDHDGFGEIVSFTYFRDSVWIHVIEPLQPGGTFIHRSLDRVEKYNGNSDWTISLARPFDLNDDGFDDYIISIRSGFTIEPRKLYLFEPRHSRTKTVDRVMGSNIQDPVLLDLDGDGSPEITGNNSAPGNIINKDVYLHDSCAWLMVYDKNLEFKIPPVQYQGKPSYVRVLPVKKGERQLLVSIHFTRTENAIINLLQLWEWKENSLQMIRSRYLEQKDQVQLLCEDSRGNGSFYLSNGSSILKFNDELEEVDQIRSDQSESWLTYFSIDVDGDGLEERLLIGKKGLLTITRNDFSHQVSLDLGVLVGLPHLSAKTTDEGSFLNVFRNHHADLLSYSKNPLYPFRLLLLLVSFAAYYFIFSFIASIQKRRIERRLASERQVLHYQLTNVMQQLDPHFLFNALSNISSYYHKGDKEHAQTYLAKISKLIRSSLENSEKMTISLQEELAFVQDYLFVEGIRMGDRFDYSIDVEEELTDGVQIPKMLIQNFVENAMKHGVRHLIDRKGLIKVYGSLTGNSLRIYIEDNGVGREKAAEIGSFGTGNGLNMVRKTLDIFEKLEKIKITFEIEDLYEKSRQPAGTSVVIKIPL